MTIIVSINQFRQNMADYIAKAKKGYTVILKDEKKDEQLIELVKKRNFNPETFGKALESVVGVFTAENHPEWQTKQDVLNWVKQQRSEADRNF